MLLSRPFPRTGTPGDPESRQSGSRACALDHLARCVRLRRGCRAAWGDGKAAQRWGMKAGLLVGIHQGLEGRESQCQGSWNQQSQGAGVVRCTDRKCVEGTVEDEDGVGGHVRRGWSESQ